MKLSQLKEIIENACLVFDCIEYGRYIGELNDELFEKYKTSKVTGIGGGYYPEYGTQILIRPNKKLCKELCNNCGWNNCWDNPKHEDFI